MIRFHNEACAIIRPVDLCALIVMLSSTAAPTILPTPIDVMLWNHFSMKRNSVYVCSVCVLVQIISRGL